MNFNGIFTQNRAVLCLTNTLPESVVTSFLRNCRPKEKVTIITVTPTGNKVIVDTGNSGYVIIDSQYATRLGKTKHFRCVIKTSVSKKGIKKMAIGGKSLKDLPFDLFTELTNCFSTPEDIFSLMWSSRLAYETYKQMHWGVTGIDAFETTDGNIRLDLTNIEPVYFIKRLKMEQLYLKILENLPNLVWLEFGVEESLFPYDYMDNETCPNYIYYPELHDSYNTNEFRGRRAVLSGKLFDTIGKSMKHLKHLTMIEIALRYPRFDLIPQLESLTICINTLTIDAQENLKKLGQLKILRLDDVTEHELPFLMHMPHLQELYLQSTQIGVAQMGINYFKYIIVLTLFENMHINNKFFETLNSPKRLKYLRISQRRITGSGFGNFESLVGLSLYKCKLVNDDLFVQLQNLELKYLCINQSERITGVGIGKLKHLVAVKFKTFNDWDFGVAKELNRIITLKSIEYRSIDYERESHSVWEKDGDFEFEGFIDQLDKTRVIKLEKILFKDEIDKEWIWGLFTKWWYIDFLE